MEKRKTELVQLITIKKVLKEQGRTEVWLLRQLKAKRDIYSNLDAARICRYVNGSRTTRLPLFYSDVAEILGISDAYINPRIKSRPAHQDKKGDAPDSIDLSGI